MVTLELYKKMAEKYGDVGSWAVWEAPGSTPKSNMGYANIFDLDKYPKLLDTLKNNVVMVGLNFSRPLIATEPFKNFHDLNPYANDFKIRYAFEGTEFYGAWMTDVIKYHEEVDSKKVSAVLQRKPSIIKENIASFRQELKDLESKNPIILAFGRDTHTLLDKNLPRSDYSHLIKITHYSHQIKKENYKAQVLHQISESLNT